jgi:hypothetical protein
VQVTEVKNKQHFKLHPYLNGSVNLHLLIEDNSISCAIFNSDNSAVHEICSSTFAAHKNNDDNLVNELNFFLKDFDVLKHHYAHISVQILNRSFTLIPKAYANGQLKDVLEFNLGIKDIKTVQSTTINNSICFAYTYNFELHSFIEKTFNTAVIRHAGAISIDLFLKLKSFAASDVLLNIHTNLIELVIKKEHELLFYNIFKWDTNEDILYFLLFSIEQNQLNAANAKLHIAANLPVNNDLFTLIKKYIRSVNFVSSKALDVPVENLPNHYYFNILNDHLCE